MLRALVEYKRRFIAQVKKNALKSKHCNYEVVPYNRNELQFEIKFELLTQCMR